MKIDLSRFETPGFKVIMPEKDTPYMSIPVIKTIPRRAFWKARLRRWLKSPRHELAHWLFYVLERLLSFVSRRVHP